VRLVKKQNIIKCSTGLLWRFVFYLTNCIFNIECIIYLKRCFILGHIEIISSPKDLDPQIVTWKGAALLAGLESSNELWISGKEWSSWSIRILKERAMFNW